MGDVHWIITFLLILLNSLIGHRCTQIIKFLKMKKNHLRQAMDLEAMGIKAKDALHIACAIEGDCDDFLTTFVER